MVAAAARIGSPASPFEFTSTSGSSESPAKYRGKTVALYFVNPGCSHCQGVARALVRVQSELNGTVQVLVATFTEDGAARMPEFLKQVAPNYPVGVSNREAVLKFLGVTVPEGGEMPRLILIDSRGILRRSLGWQDAVFQDEETMDSKILEAVRNVARVKAPKPSSSGR